MENRFPQQEKRDTATRDILLSMLFVSWLVLFPAFAIWAWRACI